MPEDFKIKYTGTGLPELKAAITSLQFWKTLLRRFTLLALRRIIGG
jgi:hypothetical protein